MAEQVVVVTSDREVKTVLVDPNESEVKGALEVYTRGSADVLEPRAEPNSYNGWRKTGSYRMGPIFVPVDAAE